MSDLLSSLGLSAEARTARRGWIGGSDANIIMGGDPEKLIRLWREKRGEIEGEDLSDVLAVQMGSFTEPFNAAWFAKQTGYPVINRGELVRHPTISHMCATLDGRVYDDFGIRFVFEAKHCGVRSTDTEIFQRYVAQLTHNLLCDNAAGAYLSAFKGNGDWCMFEYALDAAYGEILIEREAAFWRCVQTGEPPAPLPHVDPPKPVGILELDMTGSNKWASHAAELIETALAADRHEIAKKSLKSLVPPEASKCFGHGVTIARDKRGALRISSKED